MKKATISIFLILIAVAITVYFLRERDDDSIPVIGISQIATHPALDAVRAGIISGLAEKGYQDGENIRILFRNANGDPSLTLPIAEDFVRRNVAVMIPISTPSTLGAARSTTSIPIVFSGVTDPVGAGLIQNLEHPEGNLTGVSDRWPFEQQIQTYLSFFPETKTIGLLYTKGDDVSQIGLDAVRELENRGNFRLITQPVSSGGDIYPVAVAMYQRVDTIYTGIDHLILENLDALARASAETGKPFFGGEPGTVEKGGVLALTIDMHEFGRITSDLVARVLEGEPISKIPVTFVSEGELLVNRKAAETFGLDLERAKEKGAKFFPED